MEISLFSCWSKESLTFLKERECLPKQWDDAGVKLIGKHKGSEALQGSRRLSGRWSRCSSGKPDNKFSPLAWWSSFLVSTCGIAFRCKRHNNNNFWVIKWPLEYHCGKIELVKTFKNMFPCYSTSALHWLALSLKQYIYKTS